MTAFDYTEFQALADELFTEFGRNVTLNKLESSPTEPLKPWRGNADPRSTPNDTWTGPAVFLDTISSRYLGLTIQFDEGEKGEQKLFLVATASAPGKVLRDFNEVVDGSSQYFISALNILEPGPAEIFVAFKMTQRSLFH